MDIFAHALWTYAIFHKQKYKWWGAFFGILPDILSFGPFFVYYHLILGNNFKNDLINDSVFVMYNITHSLVIFTIFVITVYYITRKIPWLMFGWGMHILIDIPTHTKDFFPTPFLWPLFSLKINGISWGEPWFMIINYSLLIIVYSWIIYKKYKIKNFKALHIL